MARTLRGYLLVCLAFAATAGAGTDPTEPPIPAVNFVVVSPTFGVSGALAEGAADVLVARGYTRVIDLRQPEEGSADEVAALVDHGLEYINFPTDGTEPSRARVTEFAAMLDAAPGQRTLLFCASGNRAGMMWGLYRLEQGASLDQVLTETRTLVTREPLRKVIHTWSERPPLARP